MTNAALYSLWSPCALHFKNNSYKKNRRQQAAAGAVAAMRKNGRIIRASRLLSCRIEKREETNIIYDALFRLLCLCCVLPCCVCYMFASYSFSPSFPPPGFFFFFFLSIEIVHCFSSIVTGSQRFQQHRRGAKQREGGTRGSRSNRQPYS